MKRVIIILMSSILLLTACASPESSNDETWMQGTNDVTALQADQGRRITETIKTPEGELLVDAEVKIPKSEIEKGNFSCTLPSVDQIEGLMTDGEKMIKDNTGQYAGAWIIPAEKGSSRAYKFLCNVDAANHLVYFDNTSVTMLEKDYKKMSDCSEDERKEWENLSEKSRSLLESMGWQGEEANGSMASANGRYMADLNFISTIDGIPLVETGDVFVTSHVTAASDGIGGFQFAGSFEKNNTRKVKVISADEMMDVFRKKAADGSISDAEKIDVITLAYYIDYDQNIFYPVWCFYGESKLPVALINAENGEIVY